MLILMIYLIIGISLILLLNKKKNLFERYRTFKISKLEKAYVLFILALIWPFSLFLFCNED